jgi:hypothetical protein
MLTRNVFLFFSEDRTRYTWFGINNVNNATLLGTAGPSAVYDCNGC